MAVPLAVLLLASLPRSSGSEIVESQPNPPAWPASVKVFGPEDSTQDIEAAVNAAYAQNGGQPDHGQFSTERFAFLFKPGRYNVEVPVGYYTQVLGLGTLPSDVVFTSGKGVYCEEGDFNFLVGALNTFWRGAENFQTDAKAAWNNMQGMLWATSQAAPLRRLIVSENLMLYQHVDGDDLAGYSSGGFIANSQVRGAVYSGSQQQFLARNSAFGAWHDGVWNMVFVGTLGAPLSHCGKEEKMCVSPYVTVDSTPSIAEKPFITIDEDGHFSLNVPVASQGRRGVDFEAVHRVGFESVYVARADTDTAKTINAQLSKGLHVVLSPGIYHLEASLEFNVSNQVLLGLGLATLVASNGSPAIVVATQIDGVRIAGVLLEAGSRPTECLLRWGQGRYEGSASNPGVLSDVFARVGGPTEAAHAQADTMVRIESGNVIGDNLWLWRADHSEDGIVKHGANPCNTGIAINGDDVKMFGLQVEHTLQDLLQWNGDRGASYFFQAELPYDVSQAYGEAGYTAYRVGSSVKQHAAYGTGVYHYFRDHEVTVETGIVAPPSLEDSFTSPLAVFLKGLGLMRHIINDKGAATSKSDGDGAVPAWWCARMTLSQSPSCGVGEAVSCPGSGAACAGNSCCPDGSACPSAEDDFMCCPAPKKSDCTNGTRPPSPSPSPPGPPSPPPSPPGPPSPTPPSPGGECRVGDAVLCPGRQTKCAGDQCCLDGSTCPSARADFLGCPKAKAFDCTRRLHKARPAVPQELEIVV